MKGFCARLARERAIGRHCLTVLFFCISGCENTAQHISTEDAAQISAEMFQLTQHANATLRALADEDIEQERLFDEVRTVTETHFRQMARLGERFNALPSQSRLRFIQSAEGKLHEKRMNMELSSMKTLTIALLRDVPHEQVDFGMMPPARANELLEDAETGRQNLRK